VATFTEEEIRILKEKGFLEYDKNDLAADNHIGAVDYLAADIADDDGIQVEEIPGKRRSKSRARTKKKNELNVSELNYYLREEVNKWKPELDSLLKLLYELNGHSEKSRSLSINKINEDSLKLLLTKYLSCKPEFMKSLWGSISFDGYLEPIRNKTGIGARIYELICKGENLMNFVSYRFSLNYKYIKLFQCIVLLQRLVLKTLRLIFNEDPVLVFSFLRRTGEKEIINSFLLYDIVRYNLLELNKILCVFSGEPFRNEACMKFETSGNGKLFIWGLDRKIEKLDLKNYSLTNVENVFCEPEFCVNAEGNMLAFYRKPFEKGTYRNVQKITFVRKNSKSTGWRTWKNFRVMEIDPSVMLFHPENQSIIIETSAGNFVQIEFTGKRKNLIANPKHLAGYCFSPNGKVIFLAGQFHESISTNEISGFTFPEFRKLKNLHVNGNITGFSISSHGSYMVVANENSELILWDLINDKTYEFTENKDLIISLSFGCNDDFFASLSSEKIIRLWDIKSKKCFQDLDMKKFCVNDSGKDKQVKNSKVALLRNELLYQDNAEGLFIFKLHIARETHVSGYNKHISKWTDYLGKFCRGRLAFDKKILFNAFAMDGGENTETYNQLINSDISTLIFNKHD
jgi:WD40 repeat protein